MTRTVDAAKAARWRERLSGWRKSGLSVAEFCRRERISEASFYQWRRRLQATVDADQAAPRFVQLPTTAWPAASMQVTLPSGAVVMLSGQASVELVAAVVRAAMHSPDEDGRC